MVLRLLTQTRSRATADTQLSVLDLELQRSLQVRQELDLTVHSTVAVDLAVAAHQLLVVLERKDAY